MVGPWMGSVEKLVSFIDIAKAYAARSKDPSTKVGALILGPNFEHRAQGWNGAPRGSTADEDQRWVQRDTKLRWSIHAEANAICNAAFSGVSTRGCAILVTHPPCMDCAKLIAQSGITLVAAPIPEPGFFARWAEQINDTKTLFQEVGIRYHEF